MATNEKVLQEARALGLDVEEERADFDQLRADLAVLRVLAPEMQGYGIDVLNQGQPLTVGELPADGPKVDVSDRPKALDRFSQLDAVAVALGNALEFAEMPEFTAAGADTPEAIGDLSDLHMALWPIGTVADEHARDGSPEYGLASARATVLAAKFLLRIADNADHMRAQAAHLLGLAQTNLIPAGGDDA